MYYAMRRASSYDRPCRKLDRTSVRRSPADQHWWNDGTPLTGVAPPIELALEPLDTRTSEQSEDLPIIVIGALPLFRVDLVAALEAYGVALQAFEVAMHDPDQAEARRDFRVVNVLGVLARDELGNFLGSLTDEGGGTDVGYRAATRTPEPLRGLHMAWIEDTFTLVVHEGLRDALVAAGFDELVFSPLDEIAL